jgi:hypothetical protein
MILIVSNVMKNSYLGYRYEGFPLYASKLTRKGGDFQVSSGYATAGPIQATKNRRCCVGMM